MKMSQWSTQMYVKLLLVISALFTCINCQKNAVSMESDGEDQLSALSNSKATTSNPNKITFNNMLGINAFEWNFGTPYVPADPSSSKFFKPFSTFRHYLDWQQIESEKGKYGYNPTPRGNWKYDEIYQWCAEQGIEVLACIKTIPDWLLNTYPADKQDSENVPAPYGANLSDPASYIEFARLGFQFAARYGSNTKVDPALVHVPALPTYNPNKKRIGTGLVQYIECNNEPDRWWKPTKMASQTATEYAANLSAFYDGHKGKLGKGVGVKNADPNMVVVMAGLATTEPAFVEEMIDWCLKNRGRRKDGSIDLCFDVINYHHYARDRDEENYGKSQRGVAPELSDALDVAKRFINLSAEKAQSIRVWNTETGYDVNQNSIQGARKIGEKSALITQADWILRTSLLYARSGVDKLYFYMLHDVSLYNATQYASSGFVNKVGKLTARPAWYYLLQAKNLIGDYYYYRTIKTDPVIIDEYRKGDKKFYVLVVPDEVGRTENCPVDFLDSYENSPRINLYELQPDSETPKRSMKIISNDRVRITATETPLFLEVL